MSMLQTHTKRGRVTKYGLATGLQEYREKDGVRVTMYMEHSVIHVRCHSFNTHGRIGWQSFRNITDARFAFSVFWYRIRKGYYK